MLEQRIQQQFYDSADLKNRVAETLSRPLADAVQAVLGCITAGGKLLVCGSGGAAALAQQFAAQFIGRAERERPALAAVALNGDPAVLSVLGDDDPQQIHARQVQALGAPGDLLLLLCAGAVPPALLAAVDAAQAREMAVVALTGASATPLLERLGETDVHVGVPHERAVRVHEVLGLALHCICDAVDLQLLGEQDPP